MQWKSVADPGGTPLPLPSFFPPCQGNLKLVGHFLREADTEFKRKMNSLKITESFLVTPSF